MFLHNRFVTKTLSRFWRWLVQKAPEIKELSTNDARLAYLVTRIEREKIKKSVVVAPLFSLQLIHSITRPTALEKVAERALVVAEHKEALLGQGVITREFLGQYVPSLTWIKVIRDGDSCIAFEGNGRILTFQQVFQLSDNIKVEVELFEFDPVNQENLLAQVTKLRQSYFS